MFEDWREFAAFLSEATIEADLHAMPDTPWADRQREALRWIDAHAVAGDLDEARAALRSELGENPFVGVAEALRGIPRDKAEGVRRFLGGISARNPDSKQRERFTAFGRMAGLIDENGEIIDKEFSELGDVVWNALGALQDAKGKRKRGQPKYSTPWAGQAKAMDAMRKRLAEGLTIRQAAKAVVDGEPAVAHPDKRIDYLEGRYEEKMSLRG